MVLLWLLAIAGLLLAVWAYRKGHENWDYFQGRNIKYMQAKWMLGSSGDIFSGKQSLYDFILDVIEKYPDER